MKRMGAYISIAVAVVAIALLVVQVSRKQWQKNADMDAVDKALPVTIAAVAPYEFTDEINAVGTLKARETSLLSPKVAGTVNRVLVDIGDRVKAGEVVIKLDRTDFDLGVKQAQAALAAVQAAIPQADARFEQAEKEYRRTIELLEEKVIPQNCFDAVEAAFKAAKEMDSSVRARHERAEAAFSAALEHLKDASIRSPITGTVVERDVEIGQAVAPGSRLLRIVDQTSLKLDVDLPESDIGRLAVGVTAIITADAFPGHEFSGKVTVVNPMVKRKTRTFRVRIEVPSPSGKLVDGMFARVKLSAVRILRDKKADHIRLEMRRAFLVVGKAEKNIEAAEGALNTAKGAYRREMVGYRAGEGANTDVLDLRTALSRAEANHTQALFDYNVALTALHRAVGEMVAEQADIKEKESVE